MIPFMNSIPWLRISAAAIAAVAVYLAITAAANFIEGYVADKEAIQQQYIASQIHNNELKSAKQTLEYKLKLEKEFNAKKSELLEATNSQLMDARVNEVEANNAFAVEKLSRVAALGERANQALTYKAEKATREKLDQIEQLSDWDTVYDGFSKREGY